MRAGPPCCTESAERADPGQATAPPGRGAGGAVGLVQDVAAYRFASRSRHVPLLPSMLTRVSRARRRCSGTCTAVTGAPSSCSRSGASSSCGSPPSARRSRSGSAPVTAVPARSRSCASCSGVAPASTSGRATMSCPASAALRLNVLRSSSSSARASPGEGRGEPGPRRHPLVDLLGDEVVFQLDVRPGHPGHRGDRVVRVGDHQPGEVGRAEERRAAAAAPSRRRRVRRCTTTRTRDP